MKKITLLIVAGLLFVGTALADTPAAPSTDGNIFSETDTVISYGNNFDSLKTSADSSTIVTKWAPEEGYEYFIEFAPFTGTSKDSADIRFVADVYGRVCSTATSCGDTLFYRTAFDTIVDNAAGEVLQIPHGTKIFGDKYTIKAIAQNGGTALNVQLNAIRIVRRRIVLLEKRSY